MSMSNDRECVKIDESFHSSVDNVLMQLVDQVERENLAIRATANYSQNSGTELCRSKFASNSSKGSIETSSDRSKNRLGIRKTRYRKKHKWKPYCKLTWDERRKLEERDSRRAEEFRKKMSASGLTLAPYNTTQFLMEDHNLQEPDYESIHHESKSREDCHSNDSDDFYSSAEDEDYLQREFSETYDSIHDDYIKNMSKSELVRELMRLEDAIESAEETLKECRFQKRLRAENPELDVEAELEKIQVFQDEIEKLTEENSLIKAKNAILENRLEEVKQYESSGI